MAIADATGYLGQDGENRSRLALRLILGAPAVPALFLLIAVAMCYESPRYYMRSETPGHSIDRAFQILLKIRSHRPCVISSSSGGPTGLRGRILTEQAE
ncbi:hypothetical protein LB503_009206 [Fusarium chuoi]|nr:hypothetical protein LB503_009206 [Fusarium chuoi]